MTTSISVDTETTNRNPHKAELLGVSLSDGKNTTWEETTTEKTFQDKFIVAQNGKYDAVILAKNSNVDLKIDFDTMVAQYLVAIDKSCKLENMVNQYFSENKKDLLTIYNEQTGKNRKKLPNWWWKEINYDVLVKYAKSDAEWTYKLYEVLSKRLELENLSDWFYRIEMPLVNLLTKMELRGVKIDKLRMLNLRNSFMQHLESIKHKLIFLAENNELNLNSHKQLQEVLYKKFALIPVARTKTGYSTDEYTLEVLSRKHEFPRLLLEYRELYKLLNTYINPILDDLDQNNRIHTTYNQCLTKTRRFSSDSPNLQNIPVRSDIGKQIRECFIPTERNKFLIVDYDQIELRLIAHFSQDKNLLDWFNNGIDIHQAMADFIGSRLGREFTRNEGKTLNFSILYGKTEVGLAKSWNTTIAEAKYILGLYYSLLSGVRKWKEHQEEEVKSTYGWTKSLAGLPLYCGNPNIGSIIERDHILRCSINYLIQGSSQDILKKAIIDVYNKTKYFPVLMVHDELLYELPWYEFDNCLLPRMSEWIPVCMERAWKLSVPLKVSWKVADKWEK